MSCQCGHAACALPPASALPATRPPMPGAIIAVDEPIIAVG